MTQLLLLEPSRPELARDCARYERLAGALADDGWDVRTGAGRSERQSAVAEVVVRLLDQVPATSLDSLETILAGHLGEALPRRHNRRGRVVIYGADGQVLRIREVPHADAADPSATTARQ